jgi:GNAT superfamily N-acetyltransferase
MPADSALHVAAVTRADLADLLPLMRAYSTFYGSDPSDEDLRAMGEAFLQPAAGGTQLLARDTSGVALGHATVLWSWDTTLAQPLAVMEDLFVTAQARGHGVGARLVDACRQLAGFGGLGWGAWDTARDTVTAKRLYDRLGAERDTWYAYRLSTGRPAT